MSGDRDTRKVVFVVTAYRNGAWPNGLTLDLAMKRIYWIDARSDSIHTATYDGSDHREILRGHEHLSHPFAISLFESHVYWTDWRSNAVLRTDKWRAENVEVIDKVRSVTLLNRVDQFNFALNNEVDMIFLLRQLIQ